MSVERNESREKFEKALTTYVKEYMQWYNIEKDEEAFEEMMDCVTRMVEDVIDKCTDGEGYND